MGLGRHLVRELGFEDRRDTLARWMAHHLAELMDEAEKGPTATERLRARKSATETILKVWEHRTSLPGTAYPLASYKDVLKVLDLLRPGGNPFWRFGRHAETKRDQLASALFDGLSRLTIALLSMKVPSDRGSAEVSGAATKALGEAEQRVLSALQQWGELFASTTKSSGRARRSKRDGSGTRVNLDEAALQLIDEMTTTLGELRSELQEVRRQPTNHYEKGT